MRWLRLTVEEDIMLGDLGFKIEGMRDTNGMFVGSTGMLVAHDIVEHVNGLAAIGGIGDELMALGGVWRCRGQWGDVVRGDVGSALSPEQHIAGELPELYRYYREGVPIRMKIPEVVEDDDDEVFNLIIESALPMVRGNWDDDWDFDTWEEFRAAAFPLMKAGAIKFSKRWDNGSANADLMGNSQFWAIHDEVEETVLNNELYEGQRWRLGYGGGQCKLALVLD